MLLISPLRELQRLGKFWALVTLFACIFVPQTILAGDESISQGECKILLERLASVLTRRDALRPQTTLENPWERVLEAVARAPIQENLSGTTNFKVDFRGVPRVFDYNFAFFPSIILEERSQKDFPFGSDLPQFYSHKFVRALKDSSTPNYIRSHYGSYLKGGRLEALLFRRAIILKDIELRGANAFLDG